MTHLSWYIALQVSARSRTMQMAEHDRLRAAMDPTCWMGLLHQPLAARIYSGDGVLVRRSQCPTRRNAL